MANVITAGNSSNGGTAITTDTSGTLNIVTGSGSGSNAITIDASQAVIMPGTLAVTGAQTIGGNLTVTGSITGGSISVANSLRAWVNFNGTGTVAIRASGNVSSITDVGTGRYRLNFTTSLSDANYAVNITGDASGGIVGTSLASIAGPTTSVYEFGTYSTSFILQDCSFVNASVFR